jgi:ATP-binding cassette, subfamily B, bacterial MsbA
MVKESRFASQKRVFLRIRSHWRLLLAGTVCSVGVTGITLLTAWLFRRFIDDATGNASQAAMIAALLIGIHLPKAVFSFGQVCFIAAAVSHVAMDLRNEIYEHLQKLSLSFYDKNRVGGLMSRVMNDVALIQNGATLVVDAIDAPIRLVGLVGRMFWIEWRLALVTILFAPLMGFVIERIGKRMRRLTTAMQTKVADVTTILEETISGVRVVKSFGMEKNEIRRFRDQNLASYKATMRTVRRSAAISPVVELIGILGVGAIVVFGGILISRGEMTFADLGEFGFLAFYVSAAAKSIGRLNSTYQQTMAGSDRIFEILDEQPDVIDASDSVVLERLRRPCRIPQCSFNYEQGGEVLKDVSLVVEPGQLVAVVGPSGAGKSTIANLVPRFYDVTDGAVLVDGHDIRSLTMASLRANIGIVPQETVLFGGSVRDNIAYGDPTASHDRIEDAAKAAFAHDFITNLDDGYGTVIGERGARLSGGERQRIAIARALLKNPRILILDEATSSLDSTSEAVVQSALEVLMQGRSTLVIAHRLSTITKADKIIVLSGGRIVESGNFSELLSRRRSFRRHLSPPVQG